MSAPPPIIDGANVLFWAWSEDQPFFTMRNGEDEICIFGLAVCRYGKTGEVYRFSCDRDWETENDSAWEQSVQAARSGPSGQYDIKKVHWIKYEST